MDAILSFLPGGLITLIMIAAVVLLVRLLTRPIKLIFKLLINAAIGFVLLFIVNFIGAYIGLHIAVTWITALIAGFFGIPGVIAIIIFTFFL